MQIVQRYFTVNTQKNTPSILTQPKKKLLLIGIMSSIIMYCIMLHSSSKNLNFFHKLMIDRSVCIYLKWFWTNMWLDDYPLLHTKYPHDSYVFETMHCCSALISSKMWVCGRCGSEKFNRIFFVMYENIKKYQDVSCMTYGNLCWSWNGFVAGV